jgi:hypothetical protein
MMPPKRMAERSISPVDILDGAKTLSRAKPIWTMDIIPDWNEADEYLAWAQRGLELNDSFGYDVAVCYAKRAVCRLIDSLLINNHLQLVRGVRWYPEKIELLEETGIRIPDIAHNRVIDPRNDIEHQYRCATPVEAREAVQIAELVIKFLEAESKWPAIISLGLNYGSMIRSADTDGESWPWGYSDNPRGTMLVIDALDSDPKSMLIDHDHEEVMVAKLSDFTREEAVGLAKQLREQRRPTGHFASGCIRPHFVDFKRRLGICV